MFRFQADIPDDGNVVGRTAAKPWAQSDESCHGSRFSSLANVHSFAGVEAVFAVYGTRSSPLPHAELGAAPHAFRSGGCKARSPVCRCRFRKRLVPATRARRKHLGRSAHNGFALYFASILEPPGRTGKMGADHFAVFVQKFGVGSLEGPMPIGTGVDLRALSCSFKQQRGSSRSLDRRRWLLPLEQQNRVRNQTEAKTLRNIFITSNTSSYPSAMLSLARLKRHAALESTSDACRHGQGHDRTSHHPRVLSGHVVEL